MTITVTEVNDPPTAVDDSRTTAEDHVRSFPASDLTANDNPGPNEASQTLTVLSVAATANTHGTVSLSGGTITYTPDANYNGPASFTYTITDNGTTNGVPDFKTATGTVNFTVTSVNDAPSGASKTVTTLEDKAYTFAASDFGFSDPIDTPANSLLAVKVTTTPTAGTLADNGVAVNAGQFVSAADINAGKLVFSPAANANGSGYASFTFLVQDDGGTANGGVDLDPTARTMTINVTPVYTLPFDDSFDRNNSTTLNDDWTSQTGSISNTANQALVNQTGSIDTLTGITVADSSTRADVNIPAGLNNYAFLVSRYGADGSFYMAGLIRGASGVSAYLYKFTGGSFTMLGTPTVVASGTGTLRFDVFGSSLTLYFNGNRAVSASDSSLTTGTTGIRGSAGTTFGNFSAS